MTLDCRQAHEFLDRWLDEQLETEAVGRLEAHLAECVACRQEADARRRGHQQLAAAFADHRAAAGRVADAVMAKLAENSTRQGGERQKRDQLPSAGQMTGGYSPERASSPSWRISQLLLAVAAGFLIAVLVFRPWEQTPQLVGQPRGGNNAPDVPGTIDVTPVSVARMDLAIGPVDYAPRGDFKFLSCPSNTPLASGAVVRTAASARCELNLDEAVWLRLNENTQMRLAGERRIALSQGRLWLQVDHAAEPYVVEAGEFEIRVSEATLDCTATPQNAELLVLVGSASVKGKDWEEEVTAGQKLSIVDGQRNLTTPFLDPIVETRWVHDILIRKGPEDAELKDRIDRLWAQVGRAKLTHLYEAEIRSLGGHCATPLTCYIQSPESQQEPDRRMSAARLLADIAPPESIPQLISLLSDSSGDVRYYAAKALGRLTGEDFGRAPEAWQMDSWGSCQSTAAQWKSWWESARERYPGAQGEIESPLPQDRLRRKS